MIVLIIAFLLQLLLTGLSVKLARKIDRLPGQALLGAMATLALRRGVDIWLYEEAHRAHAILEALMALTVTGLMFYTYRDQYLQVGKLQEELTRKERESHLVLVNMDLLLRSLDMGSWMWEPKSDRVTWDRQAKKIFGLPEDFKGSDFLPFVHPDDTDKMAEYMENLRKGIGGSCTFRYVKDGKVTYLKSIADVLGNFNGRGLLITGITLDLTEQVKQQFLLEDQKNLLEQKNKEMEGFLHIASHDLQEPLRKIIYYCQKLQVSLVLDKKAREYAQWAAEGAARMQQLIMDLLDYSRAGSRLNPSWFNLSDLIGVVHANLLASIEETHAVLSLVKDVSIHGDRGLWEQLLQNLVSNGIKYHREGEPPVIKVSGTTAGEWVLVTIEDNGIGIPWEYKERIFEPFKRLHTRTRYSGTGMGLALCKRIVEKHRGRICLEATSDTGSVFKIEVPRRAEQ